MDDHIIHIHKRIDRSKYVIYAVVAFLALLTYLLVTVSQHVSNEASLTYESRADSLTDSVNVGTNLTTGEGLNQQEQQSSGQNMTTQSNRVCGSLTTNTRYLGSGQGRITGCSILAKCDDGSIKRVNCGYYSTNPRDYSPNSPNPNACLRADCEAQISSVCQCPSLLPTASVAIPTAIPTATPYVSPTPSACIYTSKFEESPWGGIYNCVYTCNGGTERILSTSQDRGAEWCDTQAKALCGCSN